MGSNHKVVVNIPSKQFILDRVEIDTVGWCWNWKGSMNSYGYGYAKFYGRNKMAHRVSYEVFRGPIADGLETDHLCRNTRCCNPDHLEIVTPEENLRRRSFFRKTHCKFGHELAGDNIGWVTRNGRRERYCKPCAYARHDKYKAEDPEKYRISGKKSYEKNKEARIADQRKRRADDPEKTREIARKSYAKHAVRLAREARERRARKKAEASGHGTGM